MSVVLVPPSFTPDSSSSTSATTQAAPVIDYYAYVRNRRVGVIVDRPTVSAHSALSNWQPTAMAEQIVSITALWCAVARSHVQAAKGDLNAAAFEIASQVDSLAKSGHFSAIDLVIESLNVNEAPEVVVLTLLAATRAKRISAHLPARDQFRRVVGEKYSGRADARDLLAGL